MTASPRFCTRLLCLSLLGTMIAPVPSAAVAETAADGWISLFDGRSLDGWRANEKPGSFKVADGAIVCDGPRSHLFYSGSASGAAFSSFAFEAEVMTKPGANSGIYFHTAYQEKDWPAQGHEVQINNTATGEGGYRENKKTGSLYGVRNLYKQVVPDNEWFRMAIRVVGPSVRVWVNDILVVDYLDAAGAKASGTFALQCHDPGSRVYFRNLRVKPLPDASAVTPAAEAAYRISPALAGLFENNYPVLDLHTHLKGGLTMADVIQRFYRTGIGAGVAVNCGLNFAVTNDAGIDRALQEIRNPLTFTAMQAEGREWVKLFSRPAVARFDYVFTDAMTIFNDGGKRMRLWIKEEVEVGEPQAFMDMLAARTVEILDHELVDIWVNPTYLPDGIAKDYDRLWTPERMDKAIAAAVRNGVAIEINDRFKLPSAAFIKRAKKAGARFTFGTNNGGREDLGSLSHSVAMVGECDLQWQDFWVPGWKPSRARMAAGMKP